MAGTVKVTVEYEGSNGISIGSTLFKFINSNDRVMLEQLSKVQLGQDAIFNALKSVLGTTEPSGIGIQEATPCDAEGTGIKLVCKIARDHAQLLFVIFFCHEFERKCFLILRYIFQVFWYHDNHCFYLIHKGMHCIKRYIAIGNL